MKELGTVFGHIVIDACIWSASIAFIYFFNSECNPCSKFMEIRSDPLCKLKPSVFVFGRDDTKIGIQIPMSILYVG